MKKFLLCFIITFINWVGLFAEWDTGELLLASDGIEYDEFGKSVSISGNYAVIGALANDENGSNSGSAYIFYHDNNNWYQQSKLMASDGANLDLFGKSVSISGNYAVIGASADDDNGSSSGSAYIFIRSDTIWTEQAKLTASDGALENNFGYSVSISGDYAVIGAMGNDENGTHSGAAYVFHRNGTIWSQQAKLMASDGSAHDTFGKSVAIFGDYCIISAGSVDSNGFCYIFKRSGTGWAQQAKLVASDGTSQDLFGYSVSIFDNYAVIGTCGDDDNGSYSGSTYIFIRSDTTWTEQAKLTPSDGSTDNYFGYSVSIFGDYAVIGAYNDDDNGNCSGSVYIFNRSDDTWHQQTKLLASNGTAFERFGRSVSISGNLVIIGADGNNNNGTNSGSAYVFQNDDFPSVIADFEASPVSGFAPLEVQFTDLSTGGLSTLMINKKNANKHKNNPSDDQNLNRDSSREITSWEWDFDNDGTIDSNEQNPLHIYSEEGIYTISLTVSDGTSTDTEVKIDYIEVTSTSIGIETISLKAKLLNNYPNPFNPSTTITFKISSRVLDQNPTRDFKDAKIEIYNLKGQKVKTFPNLQINKSPNQQIIWNGDDEKNQPVSSGIYFYQLKVGNDFSETKQMLLMK
ncbi:MAG: PKD domain-containing protein [Candidatus Cloacimonetes bacterium]|nr:PKD domain-containing protein [Candidatus Cloacimonadota bacterium]